MACRTYYLIRQCTLLSGCSSPLASAASTQNSCLFGGPAIVCYPSSCLCLQWPKAWAQQIGRVGCSSGPLTVGTFFAGNSTSLRLCSESPVDRHQSLSHRPYALQPDPRPPSCYFLINSGLSSLHQLLHLKLTLLNLPKTLPRPLQRRRRLIIQPLRMLVDIQFIFLPDVAHPFPLHNIFPQNLCDALRVFDSLRGFDGACF